MFNQKIHYNFTIFTLPDINHNFVISDKCFDGSYNNSQYSEAFLRILTGFILEQIFDENKYQ